MTKEVRELARHLIDEPNYLQSLRQRLIAGRAPHMETLLFRYAFGQPKDPVEESGRPPLVILFSKCEHYDPMAAHGKGQAVRIGQTSPEPLPRGTHEVVDNI